jgi:hypothetical protein
MTKPGAKKRADVTMNWCCPHSAILEKATMVRRIHITQDKRGLHLHLLNKKK